MLVATKVKELPLLATLRDTVPDNSGWCRFWQLLKCPMLVATKFKELPFLATFREPFSATLVVAKNGNFRRPRRCHFWQLLGLLEIAIIGFETYLVVDNVMDSDQINAKNPSYMLWCFGTCMQNGFKARNLQNLELTIGWIKLSMNDKS